MTNPTIYLKFFLSFHRVLVYLPLMASHKFGITMTPILWMRKLRLSELMCPASPREQVRYHAQARLSNCSVSSALSWVAPGISLTNFKTHHLLTWSSLNYKLFKLKLETVVKSKWFWLYYFELHKWWDGILDSAYEVSKTKIKQISQSSTYICKMLCSNTVPPWSLI